MYIYMFIYIYIFTLQVDTERNVSSLVLGIVEKSFVSVVLMFVFYSFMFLFRNSLIFQRISSKDMHHLIHLFSFFIQLINTVVKNKT